MPHGAKVLRITVSDAEGDVLGAAEHSLSAVRRKAAVTRFTRHQPLRPQLLLGGGGCAAVQQCAGLEQVPEL